MVTDAELADVARFLDTRFGLAALWLFGSAEVVPAMVIDVVGENVQVADGSGETRSFRVGYVKVVGDVREIERAFG